MMDAKLWWGILLWFLAGFISGWALFYVAPRDGVLIVMWPNMVWIGGWWLLGATGIVVAGILGWGAKLISDGAYGIRHYAEPISKDELHVQERQSPVLLHTNGIETRTRHAVGER